MSRGFGRGHPRSLSDVIRDAGGIGPFHRALGAPPPPERRVARPERRPAPRIPAGEAGWVHPNAETEREVADRLAYERAARGERDPGAAP